MKTQLRHRYEDLIGIDNLLNAWKEFIKGKRSKGDVEQFSLALMDNILALHDDLSNGVYTHGGYHAFNICDPKPRNIHKASVRDRLLHHALYRVLYPFFDKTFIADSYSCRKGKGTLGAMNKFRVYSNKVSKNDTRTSWVLKCDIRKFFASINHDVLLQILRRYIPDKKTLRLIGEVVGSFSSAQSGVGLPLGNLTSQLLVNIYMNEFDQYVKHQLKAKYYIRYADDFVFLSHDKDWLERLLPQIRAFLEKRLLLQLHPNKLFLSSLVSGVDFLGWVHFPHHRVLRTIAKRRMLKRIEQNKSEEAVNSYIGLLGHGNARQLKQRIITEMLLTELK